MDLTRLSDVASQVTWQHAARRHQQVEFQSHITNDLHFPQHYGRNLERLMQLSVKRYQWALSRLQKAGLRPTRSRQLILQKLVNHKTPASLNLLGEELRGKCNLATIYRTMRSLWRIGIVRQVNLTTRPIYFVLVGERCEYLMCNHCGSIKKLPLIRSILYLKKRLALRYGFRVLRYEAVFYGLCPDCQSQEPLNKRSTIPDFDTRPAIHK